MDHRRQLGPAGLWVPEAENTAVKFWRELTGKSKPGNTARKSSSPGGCGSFHFPLRRERVLFQHSKSTSPVHPPASQQALLVSKQQAAEAKAIVAADKAAADKAPVEAASQVAVATQPPGGLNPALALLITTTFAA